jgi:hypothetical protein
MANGQMAGGYLAPEKHFILMSANGMFHTAK